MDQRYPIGKFSFKGKITNDVAENWINEIEILPKLIRNAVEKLDAKQFDTPYRPGGWTARQVVHHLADSHMNAYIRFKLALTEETPMIKPYQEGEWAELRDYQLPVEVSLSLLEALHIRLCQLLRSLNPIDLKKTFLHPDSGEITLGENIGLYAWHGRHHLAHISSLGNNEN